jgi:small-conductance mechanosensitive channel
MPSAIAVAGIVWVSIKNLPIYLPVTLGLATGINSVVMMAMFTESLGRGKAVTLATGLSCLGFVLGWMVQSFSV